MVSEAILSGNQAADNVTMACQGATITIGGVIYIDDPRRLYLLPSEPPASDYDDRLPYDPAFDGALPIVSASDSGNDAIPYDTNWWRRVNHQISESPDIADADDDFRDCQCIDDDLDHNPEAVSTPDQGISPQLVTMVEGIVSRMIVQHLPGAVEYLMMTTEGQQNVA